MDAVQKTELQIEEDKLTKLSEELEKAKKQWLTKIDPMVEQISERVNELKKEIKKLERKKGNLLNQKNFATYNRPMQQSKKKEGDDEK